MREKIEQLAKENFKYELPVLLLSEESLNFCVEAGTVYEGKFTVKNKEGSRMKGILYCDDCRMSLSQNKFIGKEVTISFAYHAEYMVEECEFQEEISLITDCGEVVLPVKVNVKRPVLNSSIGEIRDMFQFTNLAHQQWDEALALFVTEKFDRILCYYAKELVPLYRGLKMGSCMAQAMEEFLCAIHKKVPVVISIEQKELSYDSLNEDIKDEITLCKDHWGYLKAGIFVTSSFIEVEKQTITQDDFIHNQCRIPVIIKAKQLKYGIHEAQLLIRTETQAIEVLVRVSKKSPTQYKELQKKKAIVALMRNYLAFRFHKVTQGKYLGHALDILKKYEVAGEKDIRFQLYEYHLKLASGKEAEKKRLYQELEKRLASGNDICAEDRAIFAYLTTLSSEYKKSNEEACAAVSEAMEEKGDGVLLFWCLLNLKKEYETDSILKYQAIKEAFEKGIHSPLLYYEAYAILVKNAVLMKEFGVFEQNVMLLAIKNEAMTRELAVQIICLSQREKGCTEQIYQILLGIYKKFKSKEAIQCLCSLLIRSGKRDNRYHPCFELGVSLQLRVAQLPEYYIYSMDEKNYQSIDPTVVSYFNFNNQLPEAWRAFYYACLIQTSKNPDALVLYKEEMEQFLEKQLEAGSFNVHLAVMINFLAPGMKLDEKMAGLLSKVLFKNLIICENQQMRAVSIVHRELSGETIIPLIHSMAVIDLITDQVELYLIDENGQRYQTSVPYQLIKLVHLEDIYTKIYQLNQESENLTLYLAQKAQYYQKFDSISLEVRKKALGNKKLSAKVIEELNETLITYYYENFESEQLRKYLVDIDLSQAVPLQRARIIELMIVRGLDEIAYSAICQYGWEGISKKRLFRLCENYLRDHKELKREEVMTDLCHLLIKDNRISIQMLWYLARYYYGTTQEMYELWKVAREKNIDTESLEERLLGQILFAGSNLEYAQPVFINYYRGGSNRTLIRAYLGVCAYKYLIFDTPVAQEVFEAMKEEVSTVKGGVLPLACLKYLSTCETLTEAQKNFSQFWINLFSQKGIYFTFFKGLAGQIVIPAYMTDCYDIEYRCNPKHRVWIRYKLLNGGDQGEQTALMKDYGYGIHIHQLTLFHSDVLQYCITEESKDGTPIATSGPQVVVFDRGKSCNTRTNLGRINAIIDADEDRDEDSLLLLLNAYTKLRYSVRELIKDINECE